MISQKPVYNRKGKRGIIGQTNSCYNHGKISNHSEDFLRFIIVINLRSSRNWPQKWKVDGK